MASFENEIAERLYDAITGQQEGSMDTSVVLGPESFAIVDFASDEVWIVSISPGKITEV